MHPCRAGLYHRLHEFEGIQAAAETGFCVCDDGDKPIDVILTLDIVDFILSLEGKIYLSKKSGDAVRGV